MWKAWVCVWACVSVTGLDLPMYPCCDPVLLKPCPNRKTELFERCCPTGSTWCTTTSKRPPTTKSRPVLIGFDDYHKHDQSDEGIQKSVHSPHTMTTLGKVDEVEISNEEGVTDQSEISEESGSSDTSSFGKTMPLEVEPNSGEVKTTEQETDFTDGADTIATSETAYETEIITEDVVSEAETSAEDVTDRVIETSAADMTSTQPPDDTEESILRLSTESSTATASSPELDFRVLGQLYREELMGRLKEQRPVTLTDAKVNFNAEHLSGQLELEKGSALLNHSLEIVGAPNVSTTSHRLEVSYTIKLPLVTTTYQFTVRKTSGEQMSGSVEVLLRDQTAVARMSAEKVYGTCSFGAEPLLLTPITGPHHYLATFETLQQFSSWNETVAGEVIVNSFIIQQLLENKTCELLALLNLFHELSFLKAEGRFFNEIRHDMCMFSH